MQKVTKKLKGEYIRHKLASNPVWALRGLTVIYNNQTDGEKATECTHHTNKIGFTGTDGKFFTSLGKQYEVRKSLSPKQMEFVLKRMPKYWNQILNITNERKLVSCMFSDGWLDSQDVDAYEQKQFLEVI